MVKYYFGLSKLTFFYKDVTQRMMLATWLVEVYLSKCNDLDDVVASESVSHDISNLQAERSIIEDDLRQFLETYKVSNHTRISLHDCLKWLQDRSGQENHLRADTEPRTDGFISLLRNHCW